MPNGVIGEAANAAVSVAAVDSVDRTVVADSAAVVVSAGRIADAEASEAVGDSAGKMADAVSADPVVVSVVSIPQNGSCALATAIRTAKLILRNSKRCLPR